MFKLAPIAILLVLLSLSANAAERITLTITVTNAPADADTLTVNGGVRTWKTSVVTPSTQIAVGADAGASATNLWNQIVASPYTGPLNPSFSSSNVITLRGQVGAALTASASGTWASLSLSTQTVATASIVRVPLSAEPTASVRTANASHLAADIGTYSTTPFATGTTAMQNFADLTTSQTVSNKHLVDATSTNAQFGILNAWITNGYFYGALNVSNSAPQILVHDTDGPADEKTTEITSYSGDFTIQTINDAGSGNAVIMQVSRSGVAVSSIYFGGDITSDNDITIVGNITAGLITNTPIQGSTLTLNTYSGTIGALTNGTINGSTVTNGTYYGTVGLLSSGYLNGVGSTNMAATNATMKGVTYVPGGVNFERSNHTALANGANAAVNFGDAVFIKIKAGPSAAFSIAGIASGANGKTYVLYNATGQNMTISNDSGGDPTPANRIYTGTGADIATTASGVVTLTYDSEDSRWIVTAVRD